MDAHRIERPGGAGSSLVCAKHVCATTDEGTSSAIYGRYFEFRFCCLPLKSWQLSMGEKENDRLRKRGYR